MEDNIELRKIMEIIVKGKPIIISTTIIMMVISGILGWATFEEKFESKAVVQLVSDVQDTGVISNYVSSEFTPAVFISRVENAYFEEEFLQEVGITDFNEKNLDVTLQPNTNIIELKYVDSSSNEAQGSLNLLLEETKKEMGSAVKGTLTHLEETYLNESKILSTEIESLVAKYNKVIVSNKLSEILLLQTVSSSQFVLNLTAEQMAAMSNINSGIQNELIQLKAQIDSKYTEYKNVLDRYQSVKTGLDSFKAETFVKTIVAPTEPKDLNSIITKTLPILIGLILGALIGVCWVFLRNYRKINNNL
ncbi:MAG: hypothetical protein ABS951_03615 [Solibacillus sp.]